MNCLTAVVDQFEGIASRNARLGPGYVLTCGWHPVVSEKFLLNRALWKEKVFGSLKEFAEPNSRVFYKFKKFKKVSGPFILAQRLACSKVSS